MALDPDDRDFERELPDLSVVSGLFDALEQHDYSAEIVAVYEQGGGARSQFSIYNVSTVGGKVVLELADYPE